ncbi:MAG: hypothetical protein KC486_00190 [Myxococcales bacterium]|nr:hypothetical protein [Myxococcales bacterium]
MTRTQHLPRRALLLGAAVVLGGCVDPSIGWHDDCLSGCPNRGVVEGNPRPAGLANLDALFSAVLDLDAATRRVDHTIRDEADALAVGLDLAPGSEVDAIRAAAEARIAEATAGGLRIRVAAPRCATSPSIAAATAATCDPALTLGDVEARCVGTCAVDPDLQDQCTPGLRRCLGPAPALFCDGDCQGPCDVVTATCEGTCRGVCDGACTVFDAQGLCAGDCQGACTGECDMAAGGACPGSCLGSCLYTPVGPCEADAVVLCEASDELPCAEPCEGVVEVSAAPECQLAAATAADLLVDCHPPALTITWQWRDTFADEAARAEFRAWIAQLRVQLGRLAAAAAEAEHIDARAAILSDSFVDTLRATIEELPNTFKASIAAGCALVQAENAMTLLEARNAALTETITTADQLALAVGVDTGSAAPARRPVEIPSPTPAGP